MAPLISEIILPEHSRDLSPVPNPVKKDIRRDLVLAGGDRSGRERLECQDSVQLALRRRCEKLHQLPARVIA